MYYLYYKKATDRGNLQVIFYCLSLTLTAFSMMALSIAMPHHLRYFTK